MTKENLTVCFTYFNKKGEQQYKEIQAKSLNALYNQLNKYDVYNVEGVSSSIVKSFEYKTNY